MHPEIDTRHRQYEKIRQLQSELQQRKNNSQILLLLIKMLCTLKQKQMKNNFEPIQPSTSDINFPICIKCHLTLINSVGKSTINQGNKKIQFFPNSRQNAQQVADQQPYELYQNVQNPYLKYRLYKVNTYIKDLIFNPSNRQYSYKIGDNSIRMPSSSLSKIQQYFTIRNQLNDFNVPKIEGIYGPQIKAHCNFKLPYLSVLIEHIEPFSNIQNSITESIVHRIILDWIQGIEFLMKKTGEFFEIRRQMVGVYRSVSGSYVGKVWLNNELFKIMGDAFSLTQKNTGKKQIFEKYATDRISNLFLKKYHKINLANMDFSQVRVYLKNLNRTNIQQTKHINISLYSNLKKPTPLTNINLMIEQSNDCLGTHTPSKSNSKQRKINVVTPSHLLKQAKNKLPHQNAFVQHVQNQPIKLNEKKHLQCYSNTSKEGKQRKYLVLSGRKKKQISAGKKGNTDQEFVKLGNRKKNYSPKSNNSNQSTNAIHFLHPNHENNHKKLEIKDLNYKIVIENDSGASKLLWKNPKEQILNVNSSSVDKPRRVITIHARNKAEINHSNNAGLIKHQNQKNPSQHSIFNNNKVSYQKHTNLWHQNNQNQNKSVQQRIKDKIINNQKACEENIPELFQNFSDQNKFQKKQQKSFRNSIINNLQINKKDSLRSSSDSASPQKKSIEKMDLVRYQSYYNRIITQPLPFAETQIKTQSGEYVKPEQYKLSKFLENITPIKPLNIRNQSNGKEEEQEQIDCLHMNYKKWKQMHSKFQKQCSSQGEEEKKNSFSWEISERDDDDSVSIQTFNNKLDKTNFYSDIDQNLKDVLRKQQDEIEVVDSYLTILEDGYSSANKKVIYEESLIVRGMESEQKAKKFNEAYKNSQTARKNLLLNEKILETVKKESQQENLECLSPIHKLQSRQFDKNILKNQHNFEQTEDPNPSLFALKPIQ